MSLFEMGWAFKLSGVSPLAKLVAIRIADGAQLSTIDRIAEFCGVDNDAVRAALAELEDETGLKSVCLLDCRWKFELPIEEKPGAVAPRAPDCSPHHLYVMSCADRVKVGIARDVDSRRQTIQMYATEEVKVQWWRRGPAHLIRKSERATHRALASSRIWGEWFSISIDHAIAAATKEFNEAKP